MKNFSIRKKLTALAITASMILSVTPVFASTDVNEVNCEQPTMVITRIDDVDTELSTNASTRATSYVDRSGTLAPGETISGTFRLTGWFGNDFGVIAGASNNTGGSLRLILESAVYQVPCDGQVRVLSAETGWPAGTYSYSLYNGTGTTTAYVLNITSP